MAAKSLACGFEGELVSSVQHLNIKTRLKF